MGSHSCRFSFLERAERRKETEIRHRSHHTALGEINNVICNLLGIGFVAITMTIPKWCAVVFSPPHRVVETVSWQVADLFQEVSGMVQGTFTDASALSEKTEHQLTLQSVWVGEVVKMSVCLFIRCVQASIICMSFVLVLTWCWERQVMSLSASVDDVMRDRRDIHS